MAPLTNFRFILSDPRWLAAGSKDIPARKQPKTTKATAHPGKKASMDKSPSILAADKVFSHLPPSRPPYVVPADALPLPPVDMSTLDPYDDSIGRDFSLTCIHDLRTDKSMRVPDECFLVPKHNTHSISSPAHAHHLESLRPAMHQEASGRVVDQYQRAQSMLFDDCALRSLFAVLVLALIVMALIPLDWAWFSSVPDYRPRRCACDCSCAAGNDEEKAIPYSGQIEDDDNDETEAGTDDATCMQEKQECYLTEPPAKTT